MTTKKIYALTIGIGEYKHLPKLSCATSDAEDFAAVLRAGAVPSEVRVIQNTSATKESIVKELARLAESAGPGDTAIVFFSGHAGRRSSEADDYAFLCPVEASLLDLAETCMTSDELTDALRTITSERLVVFLDTCYSGGIGDLRHRSIGLPIGLTGRDVDAFVQGSGRMVLGASRPDELAWELGAMRNGLFTSYVLRALRGEIAREDGSIWATDVFSFVSRSLRPHRSQRPYQKAVGEDFVITIQDNKANRPVRTSALLASSIDQRPLRIAMRRAYNRDELSILCRDLGISLEDLAGKTLETQLMDLIDYCHRHGLYNQLIERMRIDRPQLTLAEPRYQT